MVHGNIVSLVGKPGDVRVEVPKQHLLECNVLLLVGTRERIRPHHGHMIELAEGDDILAALFGLAANTRP